MLINSGRSKSPLGFGNADSGHYDYDNQTPGRRVRSEITTAELCSSLYLTTSSLMQQYPNWRHVLYSWTSVFEAIDPFLQLPSCVRV